MIEATEIDGVIADTSLGIVGDALRRERRSAHDGGQTFRIKNLTKGEIFAFLSKWNKFSEGTHLGSIRVVVAGDSDEVFPAEFRAENGRSITWYRNNIRPGEGLLYIETKVESDSSGLRNIFTLRDNNFLDGSFDADELSVPQRLFMHAWNSRGGNDSNMSALLSSFVVEALGHLHPRPAPVSARKFAKFCIAVSRNRLAVAGNLDHAESKALVGRALVELDLFPDEDWLSLPSRAARRLAQNAFHAELASSPTADLDPEKLQEVCEKTVFKGENGSELNDSEQRVWRKRCCSYCAAPSRDLREKIPYGFFEQLFRKDIAGMPLGERVEIEIENKETDRIQEFRQLEIRLGLDRRDADEAQRFLEHQPAESDVASLADLLSRQTRRMVEKVAFPSAEQIANPFSKLAEVSSVFRGRCEQREATIELRPGRGFDETSPTLGLFAFLFAKTLMSVCTGSEAGYRLRVDDQLLKIRRVPQVARAEDENVEDTDLATLEWKPLPLEFHLVSNDGSQLLDCETNIEWFPNSYERMALIWLFLAAEDAPRPDQPLSLVGDLSLEKWLTAVVDRQHELRTCGTGVWAEDVLQCPTMERMFELFRQLSAETAAEGVNADVLLDHFDAWYQVLAEAKAEFVPDGAPDARVGAFLSARCVDTDARGGRLMLPIHPFRLRWLARYLRESERLAMNGLAGDLRLNRQNDRMYLDAFAARSPHQQPAVSCSRNRELLLADAELGWAEQFVPAAANQVTANTSDSSISNEIYRQIASYINSHPHRADGLSVLVALSRGSLLPADLVASVRRGEWRQMVITVHVLAHREHWDDVAESFESLHSGSRLNAGSTIFPPVQLQLHEFPTESELDALANEIQCDIAIAPEFLSGSVATQAYTQLDQTGEGQFDVILDDPTYVHGGLHGQSISVSTRPANPDPALDMWSTLAVRHNRSAPVSAQQPENTDYVEVTIDFSNSAKLFVALHACAHWVITVERHISREQIESLEPSPDILTVREGVGASGMYTLIVSSNVGRGFVTSRIQKKLSRIVASGGSNAGRQIAEKVYDTTRELAPQLALQATGISRVTEEILGLAVAKQIADLKFPVSPVDGAVIWISLDDHTDWFRGSSAVRADLIRITMEQLEQGLQVDVLVVEGKLRTSYDPHGVDQVAATMRLVEDFLPPTEAIDAFEWRNRILSAIAGVSPTARTLYGATDSATGGDRYRLPLELRTAFRDGQFQLRTLTGLFAISRYDAVGDFSLENIEIDGEQSIYVARAYRNEILSLVSGEVDAFREVLKPTASTLAAPNERTQGRVTPTEVASEEVPSAGVDETESPGVRHGLDERELARRYQTILDQFANFNIDVKRASDESRFIEGPASILYRVRPGSGVDPRRLTEKADAMKLALQLTEEQNIRFAIDRGYVTLDVPKDDQDRYYVDAGDMWLRWTRPKHGLAAPIGEDRFGEVIDLEFSSANSPHLLIGGTTGSGKSEALNTILRGVIEHYSPKELRLLLVDPKGTELEAFSSSEHLDGEVGWEDRDAIALLTKAVAEMQSRYQRFREASVRSIVDFNETVGSTEAMPWWLIVLDEYADLTSDPEAKKEIEKLLKRLAQKARASGIHVIIATQKPSAQVISTNLRSNLPAQLALRVKSAIESRVVMDESGAESLNGKGDAFLKADGKLHRVQCAMVHT